MTSLGVYEATESADTRGLSAVLARPTSAFDRKRAAGLWGWEGLPWPDTVPCVVSLPVVGCLSGPGSVWSFFVPESFVGLAWRITLPSLAFPSTGTKLPVVIVGLYALAAVQKAGCTPDDVRAIVDLAGKVRPWPGVLRPFLPDYALLADPALRRCVPTPASPLGQYLAWVCDSAA